MTEAQDKNILEARRQAIELKTIPTLRTALSGVNEARKERGETPLDFTKFLKRAENYIKKRISDGFNASKARRKDCKTLTGVVIHMVAHGEAHLLQGIPEDKWVDGGVTVAEESV